MTLDLFEPISITQKERVNSAMMELPPHEPGVYTMYGKKDEVLYVGKAKNLFKRITSYRYSKSKKVQSMIAQIDRIGFEICKTEMDAILLENLLIRSLRPPFNHANKKPETYYYISTKRRGNRREFRLSMRVLDEYTKVYGCFKGHARVRKGLGALLRLLYLQHRMIDSAHYLPSQLLGRLAPLRFNCEIDKASKKLVHDFFLGKSKVLIDDFEELISKKTFKDKFTKKYFENELDQLNIFYALGPERNHQMKRELELDSHLIIQEQLDDFQTLYSLSN
ncbi:MAG: nucleotide excision repair endonuclease [Balneola sp.]|nr:nucleotide excision repair endonuclease [Balneola sp.]MBO6650588.1 nucleotide excision repair endonuclease [Balneola sp.]MBO6712633.1 nucleotide excision repair endonuclease [Balneola sp.]MBO6800873.1 nucleotide excision repair endonuclease [Balneola sp.]MBO6870546.1 nucleotide excision repair endonuclease [Balneola sp.]